MSQSLCPFPHSFCFKKILILEIQNNWGAGYMQNPIPNTGNPKNQILPLLCKIEYESISKTLARTLFNKPYFWELFSKKDCKDSMKEWRLEVAQPAFHPLEIEVQFNSIYFRPLQIRIQFNHLGRRQEFQSGGTF